ncbi:hypothetical protein [Escherichia coli]|nr:hypothetical protein [Escherichia coli]
MVLNVVLAGDFDCVRIP